MARFPNHTEGAGSNASKYQHQKHPGPTQRNNPQTHYQSRFRQRGPGLPRSDKCNFCGQDGHFERECDIHSILDRLRDYDNRMLQRQDRNPNGQVHHLEKLGEHFGEEQDSHEFDLADEVVDACLVELNLLETPSATPAWYLDSGATHHVSGDPLAFTSIRPTSGTQVKSAGGQSHHVTGVGNVDIQISSKAIKCVPSVLYTPSITKNLLSVGMLVDQHKTLIFRSNGCFVIDNVTLKVEIFAPRENSKGLYRLSGIHKPDSPELNLVYSNSQATLWHRRLGHFHNRGLQRMILFEAVT